MTRTTTLIATMAIAALCSANTAGWEVVNKADPEAKTTVHFALKQSGVDQLRAKFFSVSDPDHPDYGNYWTRSQLAEVVKPVPGALQTVRSWLHEHGITGFSLNLNKDIVTARISVAQITDLLNLDLFTYRHMDTELTIIRTETIPTVPAHISAVLEFVGGLHTFPVPRFNVTAPPNGKSVTPEVLQKLYSVNDKYSGTTKASQACAEFQRQTFAEKDLAKFQNHFGLPAQLVRNISAGGEGLAQAEANLDIQYLMGVAVAMPTDFYLQPGEAFDLLKWSSYVAGAEDAALVWSVSYGEDIETIVKTFDGTYPQRFNTEVQKLATLGISVIFASGDSGVYSRQSNGPIFRPDFPASLPAITGVGATQLNFDGTEDTGVGFSGGGFCLSKYFNRSTECPYQEDAVAHFFSTSTELPPAQDYDHDGCAYPDVSAQGVGFETYIDGILQPVSGTSAACPTFAAVVALLNDQRLKAGKPLLGFLNPILYKHPEAFNDMTKGTNRGSGLHGFTAIAGFDPVTGLGTPNYPKLKSAVLN
eukprot:m.212745 g.212745  ORF g.212745 m.212745 type:complete len:533 (-) comp17168_c0_seq6:80-1678(-)